MKSMAIRLKRRRLMPHNGAFEWRVLSGGPGIILSRMLSRFYITDICVRFHCIYIYYGFGYGHEGRIY